MHTHPGKFLNMSTHHNRYYFWIKCAGETCKYIHAYQGMKWICIMLLTLHANVTFAERWV